MHRKLSEKRATRWLLWHSDFAKFSVGWDPLGSLRCFPRPRRWLGIHPSNFPPASMPFETWWLWHRLAHPLFRFFCRLWLWVGWSVMSVTFVSICVCTVGTKAWAIYTKLDRHTVHSSHSVSRSSRCRAACRYDNLDIFVFLDCCVGKVDISSATG